MTSCIAFQGEKGAFSEEAAFNYLGQDINPLPCKSFKDVFEAVKSDSCQYGIIPIENSFTGSIHQNVDLLNCTLWEKSSYVFATICLH